MGEAFGLGAVGEFPIRCRRIAHDVPL